MQTPTPELLAFFKAHGKPSACCLQDASARSTRLLEQATALSNATGFNAQSNLVRTLDIAALCTGAIYAAQGFELNDDDSVFGSADGLSTLAAELDLSPETLLPLRQMRLRAAALKTHPAADSSDDFLAHQGDFISASLVEWSTEHAQRALAY